MSPFGTQNLQARYNEQIESSHCGMQIALASRGDHMAISDQSQSSVYKIPQRYQVTASSYGPDDPLFPGMMIFEFVNYGRGEDELAGIIEVSARKDPDLNALFDKVVKALATDEAFPLTVAGQALVSSGELPKNWRLTVATGSKTDFVIWAEVEAVSAEGEFTTVRAGHVGGAVARRIQAEWDTIFNAIFERDPNITPIQHQCCTCRANWEEGEFGLKVVCPECDGFAKERKCTCTADCDQMVIRDTAGSHLSRAARTFPCAKSSERGIDWNGDPWAVEALARKLQILSREE